MSKKYNRLNLKERVIIETLLREKKSKSYISKTLARSRSTISREINKWVTVSEDVYSAELANWFARFNTNNKRTKDKISNNSLLRFYVFKGLLSGWSPEQIAGRIKIDYPKDTTMTISHEAIYKYIYNKPQGQLNKKLIKLLTRAKSRRKKRKNNPKKTNRIINQVSIDNRPEHIELRNEIGHWEGDLIIGKDHKSCIATLVERKSRYTIIMKLESKKAEHVAKKFIQKIKKMPHQLIKTMTYDNGTEMAKHQKITNKTGMKIYFAHPYSSWERGTNENTNGLIRRYLPKGTNFKKIDQKSLEIIAQKLNNRPRKIINYNTPTEIINSELKKVA